jgi:hypothetical protein
MHYWRNWTLGHYTIRNGAKTFGMQFWFNTQRWAVQLDFWIWEIHLMKERA